MTSRAKSMKRRAKPKTGPASFARVADALVGGALKPVAAGPYAKAEVQKIHTINYEMSQEEAELAQAATDAILATVRAARKSGKYGPYVWAGETEQNQLSHAFDHARAALIHLLYPTSKSAANDKEPHPEHALTRLAILLALRRRNLIQRKRK